MQNFTMGDIPVAFGEKTPYCLGSFIWVGYDYLGESHGWPGKGSTSGIFRSNGVPRFAAHILRSLWKKEPYIHIGVLDYSFPDEIIKEHWATPPYEDGWDFRNVGRQVFPFMAATNCEEITVEYGDRTLFFAMPKNGPSGYLTGFVPFVPGTLRATGYIGGRAVCTHELHTPGKPACLRFTDAPVSLPAERNRRILLTVQAEDMQGVHVIRALDDVAFSVSGPAEIEAVDNGDSLCGLPFTTCHVPLFRGRASVLLRLSGEPGAIRLQAEAGGGFGGSAEIRTE
jgi:beta-galactosidase